MPNGLNAPVDPADPASLIRWTAIAAAAFQSIKEDLQEIKDGQKAHGEWRMGVEARMMSAAQVVEAHGVAIHEVKGELAGLLRGLPDLVKRAVGDALPKGTNPGAGADRGAMTFKWALEKVALPLLMSGVGAGITIIVARAAGAFGGP